MSSSYLLVITVTCALVALSASYPSGAPQEVCQSFTARHDNHKPQQSLPKYSIEGPAKVIPGATVTVAIKGNGEKFKGFFIQGQDSSTKKPVGKFITQTNAQTRDCSGPGSANAATHVNAEDKSTVSLKWEAPANYRGTVIFRAVIVKTYEQFWNNVLSSGIEVA